MSTLQPLKDPRCISHLPIVLLTVMKTNIYIYKEDRRTKGRQENMLLLISTADTSIRTALRYPCELDYSFQKEEVSSISPAHDPLRLVCETMMLYNTSFLSFCAVPRHFKYSTCRRTPEH